VRDALPRRGSSV